ATDGGQSTASLSSIAGGDASGQAPIFGAPIVTTPYDPANPAEGGIVAFGFASSTRLFAGTTGGQVYRFDFSMGTWNQTRIDNAAGGALPLAGLITDI